MGKTENVFMLDSKDTRVGNSKSSVSNRLFSFSIEPETNFDVTANWSLLGISDQASFEDYLVGQGATSVTINSFSLSANRLEASIDVVGVISLDFNSIQVTDVNKIDGFDSLLQIYLINNQLTEFSPSIPLPSTLQDLYMSINQITEFNPSIPLPSSLVNLDVSENLLTFFNPSIPLPQSLMTLNLSVNQISSSGYTNSEPWALAQPSFTEQCQIIFTFNASSVVGTNLQTILLTKNTIITP